MNFNYNLPLKINSPVLPFKSKAIINNRFQTFGISDAYASNPIYQILSTKEQIESCAKLNPRICEIFDEYNLPIEVNIEALNELKQGHLKESRVVAAKMYSYLPEELKKEVNLSNLQEAAMFHDYGKVLIPKNILNKKNKLTTKEREIMELHSEIGYELLKNKGLSEKTLKLIKYHHQTAKGNGYPSVDKDFDFGLDAQILTTADKYSALREKRCYKNPLGKYETLEIIAKDVSDGNISQEVYTALLKTV